MSAAVPDFLFWSGYGCIEGDEVELSNFVTLEKMRIWPGGKAVSLCETWYWMFVVMEKEVLRFRKDLLVPPNVEAQVLELDNPISGWKNSGVVLRLTKETLDADSELTHFGISVIQESQRRTRRGLNQRKDTLISSTGSEVFLVTQNYSQAELYRIHSDNQECVTPQILQTQLREDIYFLDMDSGNSHTLLLDSSGALHSFGTGSRGELGLGNVNSEQFPCELEALHGLQITQISSGGWHSAAITESGDVYLWGWNESGQLGQPTQDVSTSLDPLPLDLPDKDLVSQVSCGARHTVILLRDGKCLAFGLANPASSGITEGSFKPNSISTQNVCRIDSKHWTTVLWTGESGLQSCSE